MEVSLPKLYSVLLWFLISVVPCSSYSYCYYTYYSGYYCTYYYYGYWDTPRTIGAAVGGGISLIVAIIVLIVLCRICRGRRGFRGTTYNGQTVTTVTNGATNQYNVAYYPQQMYPQYTYGQPQVTMQAPQQMQAPQPMQAQQPMSGYPNGAFSPPSYEQAAYPNKTPEQSSAPVS